MLRPPPRSTRTDTLFPYTTLFRSQEAISVGAAMAMPKDEYLLPLHRNLGVFTTRGISLERLLHQFRGDINGFPKGRDRSFHFGSTEHHLVGMISHLGPQHDRKSVV